jgi:hypothetical protein
MSGLQSVVIFACTTSCGSTAPLHWTVDIRLSEVICTTEIFFRTPLTVHAMRPGWKRAADFHRSGETTLSTGQKSGYKGQADAGFSRLITIRSKRR